VPESDVSSYFAHPAWEAVCAVGSHEGERVNAQIAVSIYGASIVPDRPRLLVLLWKHNLTHDLVNASKTLAITLLSEDQLDLLEPLGLRSGREATSGQGKLDGLRYERTSRGAPYFPDGVGYLDCDVLDTWDLGDCTTFLAAVRHEQRFRDEKPLTWARAQDLAGDDFLRPYEAKFEADAERARAIMRW